jgi:aquaporin Z
MVHLVSIPVTKTSSTRREARGLFVGDWALTQLWLFWVAPLIGGALGGMFYRWLSEEPAGMSRGQSRPDVIPRNVRSGSKKRRAHIGLRRRL